MRILIHHEKFYDWEPLPSDVKPSERDIEVGRVRPDFNRDRWLMRVTKSLPEGQATHTEIHLPENEIITLILRDAVKEKAVTSRKEAVGHYLARYTLPAHAHRAWVTDVEVHDEGGDDVLFQTKLKEFMDAGLIEKEEKDELLLAYAEDANVDDHVNHLHERFGTKRNTRGKLPKGDST